MYNETATIIRNLASDEYLYFDEPVVYKNLFQSFNFWGICADKSFRIFVMDSSEEWHLVGKDEYSIIKLLFERVQLLRKQYSLAI